MIIFFIGLLSLSVLYIPVVWAKEEVVFIVDKGLSLPKIKGEELTLSGRGLSSGSAQWEVPWDDPPLSSQLGITGQIYSPKITRTIQRVWSCRIKANKGKTKPRLQVNYQLGGKDGSPGVFSHQTKPGVHVSVHVTPLAIHCEKTRHRRFWDCEGGVKLAFDLETARLAGTYSGTLIIYLVTL